jgi:hypothetical protein
MQERMRHLSAALVLCLSMVVALFAGGMLTPRTAHAAQVTIAHVQGKTAFAGFVSTDSTGCILTSALVIGTDFLALFPPQPGGPQQEPSVVVDISQFNLCTSSILLAATGESSVLTFHVAEDLSTGTLTASQVAVLDALTGDVFNVDITMTWDGTGSVTRQAGTAHFRTPGLVMNAVEVGFERSAVATGTIVGPGNTNFTLTPSDSAQVQNLRSGTITVTMP